MRSLDFDLNSIEFRDRYGVYRETHGCSLIGRIEFWDRLARLLEILESSPDDTPIPHLYLHNPVFQRNCDRCLELNQVDPDWLDTQGKMLVGLLFEWEQGSGLLVALNTPPASSQEQSKDAATEDLGFPGIIASLWETEKDLGKALEYASTIPAEALSKLIEARNRLSEDPETKKKRIRNEQAKVAQKQMLDKMTELTEQFKKTS